MAGLDSPYRLASAPAGTPYIADFDNDRGELPVRGGRRTLPATGLRAPAGPAVPPPGRDACSTRLLKAGRYGAVTVRSPRRGEAKASRSARVRPVRRATSAVSSAPQSMPRSR
ncbi:hypothetical protein FHX79_11429 [Streptomyces cavourensis]|nr:hypothetical protein FHX79_11429 [Streptomyces cavourensis]